MVYTSLVCQQIVQILRFVSFACIQFHPVFACGQICQKPFGLLQYPDSNCTFFSVLLFTQILQNRKFVGFICGQHSLYGFGDTVTCIQACSILQLKNSGSRSCTPMVWWVSEYILNQISQIDSRCPHNKISSNLYVKISKCENWFHSLITKVFLSKESKEPFLPTTRSI